MPSPARPSSLEELAYRRPARAGTGVTRSFEMYMDGTFTKADFEYMKALGFTRIFPNFEGYATELESLELGVVLPNWWNGDTTWSTVLQVLQDAAKLTNLVSINMMDEPELDDLPLHAPEVYLKLRREIRQAGFDQPLSLTLYGPRPEWPASTTRFFLDYFGAIDILRIDPYPVLSGKPLRRVADWINQARFLMEVIGREMPLTVVLQTWELSPGTLPAVSALRVMAYLAMFSGANTLSFFDYNPTAWSDNPGFTEGFITLMSELTGLAREFAGAVVYPILGPDDVFQAEVELDGYWTCFKVNTLESQNGTLAPLEIVREKGRCRRPPLTTKAFEGEVRPMRNRRPSAKF